jgi:hypothetical protein
VRVRVVQISLFFAFHEILTANQLSKGYYCIGKVAVLTLRAFASRNSAP